MMNYEIFKEVVKEKFMDYMPEKFKGMELVAEPVEKINVTLDGIILREEGRNISPTIYINDMYKKYQDCGDLEETLIAACDFMERAYEQTPVVDVDSIMTVFVTVLHYFLRIPHCASRILELFENH